MHAAGESKVWARALFCSHTSLFFFPHARLPKPAPMPDRPPPGDDWEDVGPSTAPPAATTQRSLSGWLGRRPTAASGSPAPTSPAPAPPASPPPPPPPPSLLRALLRRLHEAGLAAVTASYCSASAALQGVRSALTSAASAVTRRLEPLLPPPKHRVTALVTAALLALAARHVRALRALRARERDCRALAAALAALHRAVVTSTSGAGASAAAAPLHPLLEAAGYTKGGLAAAGGADATALAAVVLGEITQAAAG